MVIGPTSKATPWLTASLLHMLTIPPAQSKALPRDACTYSSLRSTPYLWAIHRHQSLTAMPHRIGCIAEARFATRHSQCQRNVLHCQLVSWAGGV